MAKAHFFNFVGGDALSRMGATWFVSYAYYCEVDPQHMAWKNVKTYPMRRNIYFTTKEHHIFDTGLEATLLFRYRILPFYNCPKAVFCPLFFPIFPGLCIDSPGVFL